MYSWKQSIKTEFISQKITVHRVVTAMNVLQQCMCKHVYSSFHCFSHSQSTFKIRGFCHMSN